MKSLTFGESVRKGAWRGVDLVEEAIRNSLNWRSRQAVSIAVAIALGLALAAITTADWRGLASNLAALDLRGRNVIVAGPADPANPVAISVDSCERLSELAAVERAGSVMSLPPVTSVQLGPRVPVLGVSPSLLPELQDHDVAIGPSLGLARDTTRLVFGDFLLRATVMSEQPEALGVNGALAVRLPLQTRTTMSCVVVLRDAESVGLQIPLVAAQLHTAGGDVAVVSYLTESFDVIAAFQNRGTRWLPLIAGIAGSLLGVAMLLMRSSELATYRLSGSSRPDLYRLLVIEQAVLAGVSVVFGSFGIVVGIVATSDVPSISLFWPWVSGLAWVLVFGAISPLLTRRSPAQLARER